MRCALIENGRVVNLAEAEHPGVFPAPIHAVEALPWTQIGDVVQDGGTLPPKPAVPEPCLADAREMRIDEVDRRTGELILAGFEYEIEGTAYRFGYDADDQGNFTKAALSAMIALQSGDDEYRQAWRGWTGETPHTLSLTAPEFLALATYAGKDHQEQCLASGWAITERLRAAATLEELAAIADDR